ncbi:MAG: beta-lactamase family protein, partial [Proteobacteria bacterium]|nr:beta-lactamase family protein [Pseudomonadota bacterium]
MTWVDWLSGPTRRFAALCHVPKSLEEVTTRGDEVAATDVGVPAAALDAVWRAAEDLYRTALYPAVQLCIRHRGAVVLDRALGHARGNAPGDWGRVEAEPATPETPIRLYSASKPVTAMLVHKLDERGLLHLG